MGLNSKETHNLKRRGFSEALADSTNWESFRALLEKGVRIIARAMKGPRGLMRRFSSRR